VNRDVRNSQADLIAEVRDIWDAKAAFWDERMGEGNAFQLQLIGPAVERLLAVRPEEQILDVGCGNGVTSRRLAHLGAHVVAIDTSSRFLELARSRSRDLAHRIEYRLVDATDKAQLLALGKAASMRWCATWSSWTCRSLSRYCGPAGGFWRREGGSSLRCSTRLSIAMPWVFAPRQRPEAMGSKSHGTP
jgi:SAM-dependent methyltransferase